MMPWKRSLGRGLHHLGQALLWLVILFLSFMWTVACFIVVMTGYCVVGCCRNLEENREGGCHDLPLICEGMSVSTAWSAGGWKWLWSLMKTDDSRCLHDRIGMTYLPLHSRRPFFRTTKSATVSTLWEFRRARTPHT